MNGWGPVLVLVLLVLPGAAAQSGLSEASQSYLEAHGPLRVGINIDAGVAGQRNAQGELTGWTVELLHLAALQLGVELDLIAYPTANATVEALQTGEVDVAGPMGPRQDAEAFASSGDTPWGVIPIVILSSKVVRIEQIDGLVGTLQGTPYGPSLAERLPGRTIVTYATWDELFRAYKEGTLQALVAPLPLAIAEIEQHGLPNLRTVGEALSHTPISYYAVKPEVQAVMVELRDSITPSQARTIYLKWTGVDLSPPADEVARGIPSWLPYVLLGVGGLILVAAIVIGIQRRAVRAATAELAQLNYALEEFNRGLEREVRRRTESLELVNSELQNFAHTVSHDLRGPLRHVSGYTELFRDSVGPLDEESERFMVKIQDGVAKVGRMLEALLVLSRATRAPLDIQHIAVDAVAREVAPEHAGFHWDIQPGTVQADRNALTVILQNLMGNATKFGATHGLVRVEEVEGGSVVCVEDDGPGIPEKMRDRVWDPFLRLQSDVEGDGIGLATVKRLALRQQGRIEIGESALGGAAFRLFLPNDVVATHPTT